MNFDKLAENIKQLSVSSTVEYSPAEKEYFHYYGLDFEEHYSEVKHCFGSLHCDGFDIATHYFKHQNEEATCFIVHGYFDHSGLYKHLINYCLKKRFSVIVYDLPGHGLSSGERASIESFAQYQQVLLGVLDFFKDKIISPKFAIGQSTGGAILMEFLLSGGREEFDKTVLLAPLVRPWLWPVSRISHSVGSLFLRRINRAFNNNSHDLEFADFLKNKDPLQYRFLPMQWVTALKKWMRHFNALPTINYQPLIIQGEDDSTVDWKYNMPVINTKFSQAEILYLKGARHQLVNESEDIRRRTYSAMDDYLKL
jgi:alpha-beta hydrolase superfamily lysophospholipase